LHRRIINVLAMLILPILAIPFAVGRARSPRAYRMAFALVLLVAFNEIIEQGAVTAKLGKLSPWVSMWLPMALLACFALWRFHAASFRIAGEGLDTVFMPVTDALSRWSNLLRNKIGWGERS
jgi:lipopolysaccharide export system permease protein